MADRISNGSVKRSLAETLAFRTREGQGKAIAKGQLSDFAGVPATGQELPSGKNVAAAGEAVTALRDGFRRADLKGPAIMQALLDLQDVAGKDGTDGLKELAGKIDADGDGKISGDEMKAFLKEHIAERIAAKKTDGADTSGLIEAAQSTGSDIGDFGLSQAGKTLQDFERSVTQIGQVAGRALALFATTSANAYSATRPAASAVATI